MSDFIWSLCAIILSYYISVNHLLDLFFKLCCSDGNFTKYSEIALELHVAELLGVL